MFSYFIKLKESRLHFLPNKCSASENTLRRCPSFVRDLFWSGLSKLAAAAAAAAAPVVVAAAVVAAAAVFTLCGIFLGHSLTALQGGERKKKKEREREKKRFRF